MEHAQGEFPCHKACDVDENDEAGGSTFVPKKNGKTPHCAGALIFLEKKNAPHQMMRIMERIGRYDHTKLNMKANVGSKPADYRRETATEESRRQRNAMKPLFVILFRPTWAAIYLVESYDAGARGGVSLCETSYRDAQRMAIGIEMAGGDVRSAWFDTDWGTAVGAWRRSLTLYAASTEECIPFSTRIRGTEAYSAHARAQRLMEQVARVKARSKARKPAVRRRQKPKGAR
jgi:hypothetical protein